MKTRNHLSNVVAKFLALLFAIALLPVSSFAEERMLEEVIVTAQKRAESVQDVPLGVTAISADTIDKTGVTSTADLVKLTPSLTFTENQNKQSSGFSIRGIEVGPRFM